MLTEKSTTMKAVLTGSQQESTPTQSANMGQLIHVIAPGSLAGNKTGAYSILSGQRHYLFCCNVGTRCMGLHLGIILLHFVFIKKKERKEKKKPDFHSTAFTTLVSLKITHFLINYFVNVL